MQIFFLEFYFGKSMAILLYICIIKNALISKFSNLIRWNFPLLLKGLRSKVNLQHLYAPPSHYKAEYLHGQLQK